MLYNLYATQDIEEDDFDTWKDIAETHVGGTGSVQGQYNRLLALQTIVKKLDTLERVYDRMPPSNYGYR